MQTPKNHNKKLATITASLIMLVFAVSFISPALSKKPDRLTDQIPDQSSNEPAGFEAYWDSRGTQRVTSIEWGALEPGANESITMFIKNKGKSPITLSYFLSNWQTTELETYLDLTWDYDGQIINFKEMIPVTFTLHAAENAQTIEHFNFDISIVCNI